LILTCFISKYLISLMLLKTVLALQIHQSPHKLRYPYAKGVGNGVGFVLLLWLPWATAAPLSL
jgi:hypothetical protein